MGGSTSGGLSVDWANREEGEFLTRPSLSFGFLRACNYLRARTRMRKGEGEPG